MKKGVTLFDVAGSIKSLKRYNLIILKSDFGKIYKSSSENPLYSKRYSLNFSVIFTDFSPSVNGEVKVHHIGEVKIHH